MIRPVSSQLADFLRLARAPASSKLVVRLLTEMLEVRVLPGEPNISHIYFSLRGFCGLNFCLRKLAKLANSKRQARQLKSSPHLLSPSLAPLDVLNQLLRVPCAHFSVLMAHPVIDQEIPSV